ncbi:hypothetical protein J4430_00310 [Candidatus Woesearchaeota archaeon]|nr:hypothetical protein [Candidatus Woesearchaeota archaeon]
MTISESSLAPPKEGVRRIVGKHIGSTKRQARRTLEYQDEQSRVHHAAGLTERLYGILETGRGALAELRELYTHKQISARQYDKLYGEKRRNIGENYRKTLDALEALVAIAAIFLVFGFLYIANPSITGFAVSSSSGNSGISYFVIFILLVALYVASCFLRNRK